MKELKAWVFDRIEETYNLLFSDKKNFLYLVFPIYIYKLFIWIFIWNFVSYVLLWNLNSINNINIFSNPFYLILFFFIIVWFLLYITFFVWFLLATIKTTKDIFEDKVIDIKENIKYWFNSIIPSFDTYWHIFAYIVLIPFYIISFWWVLFIIWKYLSIVLLVSYWLKILFFGLFVMFIFMIYRWVKINFSITSAVDNNSYTKDDFIRSVKITDWNWWRIVWNFLLLSIILWIVFSIIGSILWIFTTSIFDILDIQWLYNSYQHHNINQDMVKNIKDQISSYYWNFYLNNFIVSIFQEFFDIVKYVFVLVFTYLFYKRLYIEKFSKNSDLKKEDVEL